MGMISDRVRSFLEPPSRSRLRRAARDFERLSTALDDRHEVLRELNTAAVATALVGLVGEERASEIGGDLLAAADDLVEIGARLANAGDE